MNDKEDARPTPDNYDRACGIAENFGLVPEEMGLIEELRGFLNKMGDSQSSRFFFYFEKECRAIKDKQQAG